VPAGNRSRFLPGFLQEEGFPLKESYADGDPLTTKRGGTIVIDKGRVVIIHPRYFVQRRLIDDEGNLVDIGLDESFDHQTMFDVKVRPSVSQLLVRCVSSNGYIPILRYGSFPYASDFMLPILDTPMSSNGWADLLIDTRGKAKLFIAKEKTEAEWYEMMKRLRDLFYSELARKDYHFLGLTKDRAHLNQYLSKKLEILVFAFSVASVLGQESPNEREGGIPGAIEVPDPGAGVIGLENRHASIIARPSEAKLIFAAA